MRAFAINLPHRADKRDRMLASASAYNVPVEIVEAVNGGALTGEDLAGLVHDYPACGLSKGVIGCALSHLKTYKRIIDANLPIALVLEDDAILNERVAPVLAKLEETDKNETPAVYLLSSHYYAARPLRALDGKHSIHKFADGSQGHGYVLNQKAAGALYKNLPPIKWEADKWYYFEQMGLVRVYCVVPHVIPVDGGPEKSDLYKERSPLKYQRRRYLRKLKNVVSAPQKIRKFFWKTFRRPFARKS